MPDMVRLAAEVPDGELRIYWDRTDDGDCLHAWGPSRIRVAILDLVAGKRLAFREDADFGTRLRLEGTVLERAPSLVEELEARGYDPRTLVLSVRKKGMPAPPVAVPDDLRGRLDTAGAALKAVAKAVEAGEEAKGIHLYDAAEMDRLRESLGEAEAALGRAVALLDGTDAPLVPAEDPGPPVGAGSPPPGKGNGASPVRFGRDTYDRVLTLRWEDATAEHNDEEDPVPVPYFRLYDNDRHVGDAYGREDGGFRWRCFPTDFRSSEATLQEARDALLANYARHYVDEARELVRAAIPRSS